MKKLNDVSHERFKKIKTLSGLVKFKKDKNENLEIIEENFRRNSREISKRLHEKYGKKKQ